MKICLSMYRIDASYDDGSLCRLVNDDHRKPNSVMRLTVVDGAPHLYLFALRDIIAGQEIVYNYGNDHTSYPWRLCHDKVGRQVTFYSVSFCIIFFPTSMNVVTIKMSSSKQKYSFCQYGA